MNWEIVGHQWAVEFLRCSIANDRAAHAYLISGPAQLGKALLALRIAQVLNCENRQGAYADPCLQCRSCGRIARGNHPDVRIAGLASQAAGLKPDEAARQRDLKIDTIREWQADINLRPYEGQRRVFLLHDAERMSESAANAMLKTLEEPPPYATLILVANTAGDLLQTIVSRCQPIKLRPVPRSEIAQALHQRLNIATADADLLAAWSGGRPGWAFQMATNPDQLVARQEQIDALAALVALPRAETLRWAEEQTRRFRGGEQALVYEALDLWQSWWRDLLLIAADCPDQITHIDRRAELQKVAKRYRLADLHGFIRRISTTSQQLRENANPQLALENMLLHIPQPTA
jgi:DNA polymerase-3 subunit delta'